MTRLMGCLFASLLLHGCAQNSVASDRRVSVKQLYTNHQCGDLTQPTATWITTTENWQQFYARATRLQMTPPPPKSLDFSREGVLLVAMGQRPTAGYGLTLATPEAVIQNDVLRLQINWIEPSPDYRLAQVVTNPCLFLQIPKASFKRIEVRDESGTLRLEGKR